MGNLAPPLVDLYSPIRDDLTLAQRIFDEELVSEFAFVNRLCGQVRSYRGKMLRPALLLLSGKATGELSEAHHTLAAVVEMVHMATLVHDDVLDEADERRRRPTICATAGNLTAVLLGDYLISHAFHLCSALDSQYAARRIGATTNTVCEGELLQNHQRGNDRLSEADYLEIIRRKTGSLTATACELGAHFAGADEAIVGAMREHGMAAGVAFQIIDDVLDITGDRHEIGKTLGSDITFGKLTLPTIHCLANAGPATASALRVRVASAEGGRLRGHVDHRSEDMPTQGRGHGTQQLREWLTETGSVEYAVSVAADYVHQALRQLDLLPPGEAKTSLVAMAEFIIGRRF